VEEQQQAIFAWQPPLSSLEWATMLHGVIAEYGETLTLERLAYWLRVAWRQLVTAGIRRLWRRYTDGCHSPSPDQGTLDADFFAVVSSWAERMKTTVTAIAMGTAATRAVDLAIQKRLCAVLVSGAEAPVSGSTDGDDYLLFFDGGSRGNPGPGGSGSVIVKVSGENGQAAIVWAAAMAYGSSATTNNMAEYRGLCTGLRAAVAERWQPLTVIGDSLMIIRQMRRQTAPASAALRPAYHAARAAASKLSVKAWIHHYREHNKMADCAANVAMDLRASLQERHPAARPELAGVQGWLNNDYGFWLSRRYASSDLAPD
jgi:ribonuclease HI